MASEKRGKFKVILEDFVMLGTTVPEPNNDGRIFVCSAGVSEEYRRLVRIYPLARRNAPQRWAVNCVRLERNPRDSREESFQVAGDRRPGAHQWINYRFEAVKPAYPRNARADLLSRHVLGSIHEANAKRASLAIIHPDDLELHFQLNPPPDETPQLSLFQGNDGEQASGAGRFRWMPRLRFRDECGRHDLMLRDWGSFEFQRKNEESYFLNNLHNALHLSESSSLLVGNMNKHRTTWLVVAVLNNLRKPATLFDAPLIDRVLISENMRLDVYRRDEWKCVRCGSGSQVSVEPRVGLRVTGDGYSTEQLETVCRPCVLDQT